MRDVELRTSTNKQYLMTKINFEQLSFFCHDLVFYTYEVFIQILIKNKIITEAETFNLLFRYIDDVLSIDNPHFANRIPSRTV